MYNNDELISIKEAAKECGRNPETVRRWVWSGKLPAQKLGNQLFIRKREFVGFCRETATLTYEVKPKEDFLERAILFRNKMKTRGMKPIDSAKLIREMREERMCEPEQRMH